MRLYILVVFTLCCVLSAVGQFKEYFDKAGKAAKGAQAYYYRVKEGDVYKCYYVNGGALYFEGTIVSPSSSDEEKNVYQNTCKWYHKNGSLKAVRTFNSGGQENGLSVYYYESGKKWREKAYNNGVIAGNRYKEYNEDGKAFRIFEEDFDSNMNDWDLYTSDKSAAVMNKGVLTLASFAKDGTSRYISLPVEAPDFTIEVIQDMKAMRENDRAGIIFGFKDWQNYSYFVVTQSSFYVGHFYEGVHSADAEGMFTSAIVKRGKNTLRVLSEGKQLIFSLNGEVQLRTERNSYSGSYIGLIVGGKTTAEFDRMLVKEIGVKDEAVQNAVVPVSEPVFRTTGSGLIISKSGYVVANFHSVEGAKKIQVEQAGESGMKRIYNANLVQYDRENDLAILKITEDSVAGLQAFPYSFKEGGLEIGSAVFSLVADTTETGQVRVMPGTVSSKTGYNNAVNSFQASMQNASGKDGPVFTDKGELAGFAYSPVKTTDNAAFVVKLNYIRNLIELLPENLNLSKASVFTTAEERVKAISSFIVLIKTK